MRLVGELDVIRQSMDFDPVDGTILCEVRDDLGYFRGSFVSLYGFMAEHTLF